MDGPVLCHMNQEEMTRIFGPQLGPHLYESLEEYKTKHGKWNYKNSAYLFKFTFINPQEIDLTSVMIKIIKISFIPPELQSLSGPELSETCQLLDNFLDNLDFPLLSSIRIGHGTYYKLLM